MALGEGFSHLQCVTGSQQALQSFKESVQVSLESQRLPFSSRARASALVLMGCEIRETKLLKPARPEPAWTQWSFPWYRRAQTSLFAGLELTPSPAFSAARTEAVLFLIGPFFLAPCGFPFSLCSSHPASLKLDHRSCGLQDCFLCVILLWLSGSREESPGAGDGSPVSFSF